jgi:hypothetical protein
MKIAMFKLITMKNQNLPKEKGKSCIFGPYDNHRDIKLIKKKKIKDKND